MYCIPRILRFQVDTVGGIGLVQLVCSSTTILDCAHGMQALEDSSSMLQALRQNTQTVLDSAMLHFVSNADKLPGAEKDEGEMDEDSNSVLSSVLFCMSCWLLAV